MKTLQQNFEQLMGMAFHGLPRTTPQWQDLQAMFFAGALATYNRMMEATTAKNDDHGVKMLEVLLTELEGHRAIVRQRADVFGSIKQAGEERKPGDAKGL